MATAKFFIEKRRDKNTKKIRTENVPIRLVFCFDGNLLTLATGERVDAKHWDHKAQRVRKTARGSKEINDILLKVAADVHQAYRELRMSRGEITPQILISHLRKKPNKKVKTTRPSVIKTVFTVFDDYLKAKDGAFTLQFTRMMIRVKKYLGEFAPPNLSFDDIDVNFMEKYSSFLTAKGLSVNTVAGEIKRLKMFLNHSIKNGDSNNLRYKGFTAKTNECEIFFLTTDELKFLYNLEIPDIRLEQVRDVFIFGCLTALRHSDLKRLRHDEIYGDFIRFRQVKTRDQNSVPLFSITKAILKKYESMPGPLALPVISGQKMNDYLRELGKFAGFNEPVTVVKYIGTKRIEETYKKWEIMTTHMMRRSFISNSLLMKMPESEVMAISGHKSYSAFKRYFKVRDEQKLRAMQVWETNQGGSV